MLKKNYQLIESKIQGKKLLKEAYVNLWTPEKKKEYSKLIWTMIQKAYEHIGGFKGAKDEQDLIDDSSLWKLVRKGGHIVAFSIYKDKNGRKCLGCGTDGTKEGKEALFKLMQEDIKLNRSWSEVSGAAEHLKMKFGAIPIPNQHAADILKKPILDLNPDGYHYTREIAGHPHEKMMVGKVQFYPMQSSN